MFKLIPALFLVFAVSCTQNPSSSVSKAPQNEAAVMEVEALSASITPQGLVYQAPALDFGMIPKPVIGKSTIMVENKTNQDQAVLIDSSQATAFNFSTNCTAVLRTKRACQIQISLMTANLMEAELINQPLFINNVEVALQATVAPAVPEPQQLTLLYSGSLNLGSVDVNSVNKKVITIYNQSSKTKQVVIDSSALNKFSIAVNHCPAQLATKRVCQITLALNSASAASVSETLVVNGESYALAATIAAPVVTQPGELLYTRDFSSPNTPLARESDATEFFIQDGSATFSQRGGYDLLLLDTNLPLNVSLTVRLYISSYSGGSSLWLGIASPWNPSVESSVLAAAVGSYVDFQANSGTSLNNYLSIYLYEYGGSTGTGIGAIGISKIEIYQ